MSEVISGESSGTESSGMVSGGEDVGGSAPEGGSISATGTTTEMGDFTQLLGTLPEDLRNDPSLKDIKSLEGLAKSHISAQKMLGRERLSIPGEEASDEERAEFYTQLGRPANPEGYGFRDALDEQTREMHGDLLEGMSESFFEAGVSDAQAARIVEGYLKQDAARVEQMNQFAEVALNNTREVLQKEWGDQMDANLEIANEAARTIFEGDSFEAFTKIRLADGSYLGDSALMAKLMLAIGETMQEGNLPRGTSNLGMTEADAQARLAELQSHEAYLNPDHPQHQEVLNERMRIREALGGGQAKNLFEPQL